MNKEDIKELKEYIFEDCKYNSFRANIKVIMKKFPNIYNEIKDNYKEKMYMLLNDINEVPKCKNPKCNNKVLLQNMTVGFKQFCCNKCIGQYQKTDEKFKQKIRNTHNIKSKKLFNDRYDLDIVSDGQYYIVKNYCKHGDAKIYNGVLSKQFKLGINLCFKCKEEYVLNNIPAEEEINTLQNNYDKFFNTSRFASQYNHLISYHHKEYNIIYYWSKHLGKLPINEQLYLFKHRLKEIPKCPNCGKDRKYVNSQRRYTHFCDSPACVKNISKGEIEVFEYIKSINKNVKLHKRIGRSQYDIVCGKYLIEYNGIYWHSENNQKDNLYHYKKWKLAKDKCFELITIWEDDWESRKDVIKSLLNDKLKLDKEKEICFNINDIKEVSIEEARNFLKLNSLYENIKLSKCLGFYKYDELLFLISIDEKGNILNITNKIFINMNYESILYSLKVYLENCNIKKLSYEIDLDYINEFIIKNEFVINYENINTLVIDVKGRNKFNNFNKTNMENIYNLYKIGSCDAYLNLK